jgi:uncharacterized protein YuzE
MRIRYDPDADVLYFWLVDGHVDDSDEIEEGIIVDYDSEDSALSVELLDTSKRLRENANSEALSLLVDAVTHKVT